MDESVSTQSVEEADTPCCLGAATVAKFWCPGMVVSALWWNDAIAGSCDLSTSHDQDTERIGCESEGYWFYGTTMIFG